MELSGNFRSRPELIGAVNLFGAALFGDAYRPLRVGAPPPEDPPAGQGPPVELLLTARDGWDEEEIELEPAIDGRTPLNCLAEARAVAARLRELADAGVDARRDGRAAARLHPPRRLRGLARARRPAALRRRRPRLLVPAAGLRRLRAAGDDRQPARRPGPLRRPRLPRLRRSRRTRSGCCGRPPGRGATSGRRWSGPSAPARRSWPSRSGWRRSPPPRSSCCAASRRRSPTCASAGRGSRWPA